MDITSFFAAFFSDWVGWMSGIFSVALVIWGFLRPKGDGRRAFLLVAAGAAFFVAPIHIWTIEHRARLTAEDNNRPQLAEKIDAVIFAQDSRHVTLIILDLSIQNSGAPSIAQPWRMFVSLGDREFPAKILPAPHHDITINPGIGIPGAELDAAQYLGRRAVNDPIARGGGITGWMMYAVPDLTYEELASGKAKISLEFRDVNGNPSYAREDVTSLNSSGNVYMPLDNQ